MRARFGDWLDRFFNLQGQTLDLVAPVVQPVIEVAPFDLGLQWIGQVRSFACNIFVAAAAAEQSVVRLRNPVNSGVMCIVERIQASTLLGGSFAVSIFNQTTDLAGLPAAGGYQCRDGRIAVTTLRGACNCTGDSINAAVLSSAPNMYMQDHQAADPLNLYDAYGLAVLPPGWSIDVYEQTPNVYCNGGFWWRERALPPLEIL